MMGIYKVVDDEGSSIVIAESAAEAKELEERGVFASDYWDSGVVGVMDISGDRKGIIHTRDER